MILTIGQKIVLADIVLMYVLPPLYFFVMGERSYFSYYEDVTPTKFFWLYLLAVLVALFFLFFLSSILSPLKREQKEVGGGRIFSEIIWLPLALTFFFCSLIFFLSGLSQYRYDGGGVASRLSFWFAIAIFLQPFFSFQAALVLISDDNRVWVSHSKVYWTLVSLGMFLSVNGSMSLLLAVLISVATLFRDSLRSLIYNVDGFGYRRSKLAYAALVLLGLLVAFGVWLLGESVKRNSFSSAIEFLSPGNLYVAVTWVIERFSTLYFSINKLLHDIFYEYKDINRFFAEGWNIIAQAMSYRMGVISENLVGDSSIMLDYKTIAHYNYFIINSDDNPLKNAGASPGILGSAVYIFPLLISPICAAVYYWFVSIAVDLAVLNKSTKLTIFGYIVTLFLLRGILLSPADAMLIVDQNFINLLIFAFVVFTFRSMGRGLIVRL